MLATPDGSSIIYQDVPEEIQNGLNPAFEEAKQNGIKEAVVIATHCGDLNLQVVMLSGRYSLVERISRDSAARDFKAIVQRLGPRTGARTN